MELIINSNEKLVSSYENNFQPLIVNYFNKLQQKLWNNGVIQKYLNKKNKIQRLSLVSSTI